MKTNPYVAVHCWKALSLRIVRCALTIIFIKGPIYKLHIKFSVFTSHLHLKVLSFSQVKSSACIILWKNCIFANNFCKWRQMHVKMLISVCENMYFQRPQHQWTHTLKEQCSHLNLLRISPYKTLSGAHSQIGAGTNSSNILLWKNDVQQNLHQLSMRTCIIQSMLHGKLNTLEKSCTFKDKCS